MSHIYRHAHLSVLLHRTLVSILQRYINDPRLQQLTITHVKVSKKLNYADINFTHLDTRFDVEETLNSLKKASSRIRYCLSKELTHIRAVPSLRFHYDTGLVKSALIYAEINKAMSIENSYNGE